MPDAIWVLLPMVSGDRLNDAHRHTFEDRPPPDVVDLRTTGAAFARGRLSLC